MTNKMVVYLLFGPQGSGKSTQGKRLAERLHLPYFDAGSALRDLANSGTDEGKRVEAIMEKGELVPNQTLKTLFKQFMADNDCTNGLVADGFPRNEVQIELLDELALDHHWHIIGIFIDLDDETAKERLSKRTIVVDGQEVKRDDDQPEIVQKRLETFKKETLPVVDWLKTHWQVLHIDGRPPIDDVTEAMMIAVNGR